MINTTVRKAVFPIAGLGTRFLPATKASPKEMLPVVDKPLIQYAVEEAYAAGIRQMIFVTGRLKRAVEDHFDMAYELETELELALKNNLLELIRKVRPADMQCVYVRQPRALGLGHAVLCAEELVGQEPFALLLADDLMLGKTPVLTQMIEQFNERQSSIIALHEVPRAQTERYGIVVGDAIADRLIDIQKIVEKPHPDDALSTVAVAGRYILTPRIFKEIATQGYGVGKEIQLTDGIASLLQYEKVYGYNFDGVRYDCGTKLGFLQATVDLAENHAEVGLDFSSWLETRKRLCL